MSFAEHIGSFNGRIAEARPDDLGAGTTSSSVGALWTATRGPMAEAMSPDASPADRQALFDRWVDALGLPLRQDVRTLGVTRYMEATETSLLLLESPETLEFTKEIAVEMTSLADRRAGRRTDARLLRELATANRRQRIILLITEIDGELQAELDARNLAAAGGVRDFVVLAQRRERTIAFHQGPLPSRPRPPRTIIVNAKEKNSVPIRDELPIFPVLEQLKRLNPGDVALLTSDANRILDVFEGVEEEDERVELSLLQDGAARRLLIIPHDGLQARPFGGGRHSLQLSLDRERWPTSDPPDETNRYCAAAVLNLRL